MRKKYWTILDAHKKQYLIKKKIKFIFSYFLVVVNYTVSKYKKQLKTEKCKLRIQPIPEAILMASRACIDPIIPGTAKKKKRKEVKNF